MKFNKLKTIIATVFIALAVFAASDAFAWSYASALKDIRNNAITTYAGNAAFLDIYNGTPPATCGTATTSLITYTWGAGNAIANTSSSGVMAFITTALTGTVVGAGGTATWARITKSDHTTCVLDFTVGAGGSGMDMILGTTTLSTGLTVTISSLSLTSGS